MSKISFIFSILLIGQFVAVSAAVASDVQKLVVTQKLLTDEDLFNLQTQRVVQREKIIEKNKAASSASDNIKKANDSYAQAQKSFKNSDYPTARKQYEAAVLLHPESDQIYFDYAKCLYKMEQYKLALSIFLMLENTETVGPSANYYEALSLYRLKNTDMAVKKFKKIQESDDQDFASSASMYLGQIYFQQTNFSDAKKYFEFVLDHSKDPQLDKLAEQYIEQANQQEQLLLKLKKRFGYSVYIGVNYDDDVLNVSQQDAATSAKAYRASYGGNLHYHVINTPTTQWSPTFMFSDMYSLDTHFKKDATIQATDPLTLEFDFPYTKNFNLEKAPSSFQITPAFQMLYMTKDTTKRELITNTVMLNSSFSTSHIENLTTQYKLDISRDQSYLTITSVDDDQTAQKYTFTFSNSYILNKKDYEYLILDLAYTVNDALGKEWSYKKILTSLMYIKTLNVKWNSYLKLEYFNLNYDTSSTERKDKSITAYLGGGYMVTPTDTVNINLQYSSNQSTVDTYKYNKFIFSTTYTLSSF